MILLKALFTTCAFLLAFLGLPAKPYSNIFICGTDSYAAAPLGTAKTEKHQRTSEAQKQILKYLSPEPRQGHPWLGFLLYFIVLIALLSLLGRAIRFLIAGSLLLGFGILLGIGAVVLILLALFTRANRSSEQQLNYIMKDIGNPKT